MSEFDGRLTAESPELPERSFDTAFRILCREMGLQCAVDDSALMATAGRIY